MLGWQRNRYLITDFLYSLVLFLGYISPMTFPLFYLNIDFFSLLIKESGKYTEMTLVTYIFF